VVLVTTGSGPLPSSRRLGLRIADRYLLEEEAGAGAMGIVYRGRDVHTGAVVAVKLLQAASYDALSRFEREAEVLSRLRHPQIVGYLAHGTADGKPYLVMEWLQGESLAQRLDRAPLRFLEAIDIGRAIAAALVSAHSQGIIHRDLKPGNVFLVGGSTADAKVVDFGIARLKKDGQTLTGTGEMLGTPAYMSPEQAVGARDVDARSDIYSLGATLFRCVTGEQPFEAENALSLMLALTTTSAPSVSTLAPGVPRDLATLIDAMLSSDPAQRPQSAMAVHQALTAARANPQAAHGVAAQGTFRMQRPRIALARSTMSKPKGTPWVVPAMIAGALVLGGLATVGIIALSQGGSAWGAAPAKEKKSKKQAQGSAAPAETGKAPAPAPAPVPAPGPGLLKSGESWCMIGALACGTLTVADPKSVDPMTLYGQALVVARAAEPKAEFSRAVWFNATAGTVDLRTGAMVAFHFSSDVMVNARDGRLAAWPDKSGFQASPFPKCSGVQSYEAAVAAGHPRGVPSLVIVNTENAPGAYGYLAQGASTTVLIDMMTCARKAP